MSSGFDIRSEGQARAILKLAAGDPPSMWRPAFQREVKACHPDQGGDADRVRLVIEAYRFLTKVDLSTGPRPSPSPRPARPQAPPRQAAPRRPEPEPEPTPAREPPSVRPDEPFRITIVEAFRGADKTIRLQTRKTFMVRLPAGLQTGDVVRFGDQGQHRLTIEVAPIAGGELKGADLWLTVAVSDEFLREGGRMEVETPLGPRKFWVSRTSAARGLFRAPGEGLPARANRDKGHLYLAFERDESLNVSPAKSLLARFAAVWAAE